MVRDGQIALAVGAVSKSYGATVALERVDLVLKPGEVHALLGENGAGKSTLVKVLSGVVRPDSGSMSLDGGAFQPRTILEARGAGVATAFQELSLLPNLTVAENLMLPRMPRGVAGLASASAARSAAAAILKRYELSRIDAGEIVSDLSLADRQRLEIVRAMEHATKVLVLDEPTAALAEVDWLFGLIRQATARGVAVLYISHRLAEVRALCSRATVLRNGRSIATVDLAGASDADIFEMMVGRAVRSEKADRPVRAAGAAASIAVDKLSGGQLKDVTFALRQGEVLAVAALEGQGQRDLFRMLAGLAKPAGGVIRVDGKPTTLRNPQAALKAGRGIAYVPEERKTEGILSSLTAAGNITLPVAGRIARGGLVWSGLEAEAAASVAASVDLAARYLAFPIADLSGGNQQKALLARTLLTGASTLLLFDPTRGVDVGTKQSIYAAIRRFADAGGSVLFYSSELPEVTDLADRCLVLYGGRIFAEFSGDELEEQRLVGALVGHAAAPKGAAHAAGLEKAS
ncbi:sugar ABC transporter ATP-binding protein [Kaistia nematophila]|uniref:Sugar ABC transporter ATP-binding protein n=1 Tax=Kaistia nematophila TaxID=2994654 RepID=A0A9X3IMG6_9HYPH|nr:sugar ABC transporter ATP-binding protein [Kaistia nematophila]MCX5569870.1 sugar ABC transporter ATP-binding protein [Kaistia nematophila]